ncbi:MAG: hypothetical protein AAGN82_02635 [Myxococcota bacterium]
MPFGLGPTEILIILAVAAFLFGPKGVGKLVKGARKAHALKQQYSPQAMLTRLVTEPPRSKPSPPNPTRPRPSSDGRPRADQDADPATSYAGRAPQEPEQVTHTPR